jgi:hypothetical protein
MALRCPLVGSIRPADGCAVAGRFRRSYRRGGSKGSNNNPELSEAAPDLIEVLDSPVLHDLGSMPCFAEMGLHAAYHSLGLMAQLPGPTPAASRPLYPELTDLTATSTDGVECRS